MKTRLKERIWSLWQKGNWEKTSKCQSKTFAQWVFTFNCWNKNRSDRQNRRISKGHLEGTESSCPFTSTTATHTHVARSCIWSRTQLWRRKVKNRMGKNMEESRTWQQRICFRHRISANSWLIEYMCHASTQLMNGPPVCVRQLDSLHSASGSSLGLWYCRLLSFQKFIGLSQLCLRIIFISLVYKI